MFTNPLNDIRIASPCKSDWNEMYGDDRRRFCSECRLNVYNLSGMTRREAESLLINSEGRLCVRFFRRRDGTVLTKDCPVGWKAIKKRVSRTALAFSSVVVTFFAGVLSLRGVESAISYLPMGNVPAPETEMEKIFSGPMVGEAEISEEWEGKVDLSTIRRPPKKLMRYQVLGRVDNIQRLEDTKVEAWVK
jgi:hypothetical protein